MERGTIDMEKLKLCFSTLPCMDYTAEQLKETCEQYGMSGVEVRYSDNGFVYSPSQSGMQSFSMSCSKLCRLTISADFPLLTNTTAA